MKKLFLLFMLATSIAHGGAIYSASEYAGYSYTNRTTTKLGSLVTEIGTNEAMIRIDGGWWGQTGSNSLVFPSNVGVFIEPGSGLYCVTNTTIGFQGGPFIAGDYPVFNGSGGTATGTASFIYRWPAWGDTTTYDIGGGIIFAAGGDTNYVLSTNLFNSLLTQWPNLDTNKTDNVAHGFITGAWPLYSDTNTVTISEGYGLCNGNKWYITNTVSHDMTSLNSSTGFAYIYIDDSESTYPSNLVFYDTLTTSVWVDALGGEYCSTSTSDRLIGSLKYATNSIPVYYANGPDYLPTAIGILADNMQPDGTLQEPATANTSTNIPSSATHVLIRVRSEDAAAPCEVLCAPYESTEATQARYLTQGYDEVCNMWWIQLGVSKDIRIGGAANDDAAMDARLHGWRIRR